MSTIESILTRSMSDPAFAEALIAKPAETLAEYDLSAEELAQFQGLSQVEIDALVANPENRKSFSIFRGSLSGEGKKVTIDFCK
jgi:hypothetical protein